MTMSSALIVAVCAVVVLQCVGFGQLQKTLEDAELEKLTAEVFNLAPVSTTNTEGPKRGASGELGPYLSSCVCVPNYLCKNTSVVARNEGYIDSRGELIRLTFENHRTVDPIYPSSSVRPNSSDVESKPTGPESNPSGLASNQTSLESKPSGSEPKPNVLESNLGVVEPKPSGLESNLSSVEPKPSGIDPKPSGCGYRNPDGVGFRIAGNQIDESKFGEFPWMVAVLWEESIDGQAQGLNVYQCGGALIHPQAVITAAHCVVDKAKRNSLKIRAGEWDTQTTKELFPYQDRSVSKVIVHEKFYSGGLFNDIAVLILDQPVEIAENVNVVCLPQQDTVTQSGTRCFASGWGKNVYGQEGLYQVILKKIELPIVGHDACQDELRKTRMGKLFELHNSFICAGGEGKDTCKGDGGSPLVCPIEHQNNRYYQAGIVVWGIGCAENNIPGVYVDVAKFISWINEQMVSNQLDINSYSYA